MFRSGIFYYSHYYIFIHFHLLIRNFFFPLILQRFSFIKNNIKVFILIILFSNSCDIYFRIYISSSNRFSTIKESSRFLLPISKVGFHSQKLVQFPQRSFKYESLFGFQNSPVLLREETKSNTTATKSLHDGNNENHSKVYFIYFIDFLFCLLRN